MSENCFYLDEIATQGIQLESPENPKNFIEGATSLTREEMTSNTLVDRLNSRENIWTIVPGKNNGYPIFHWMKDINL